MKDKLLSPYSLNTDVATLLLRLLLGGLFMYYGYNKLMAYSEIAPEFPDFIGIGGVLSFNLVIFSELVCGFTVLIGLLTRLSAIPMFITMFVAYFIAHADDTFDDKTPAFVYMVLSLIIFVLGSGKYSVDKFIFKK